MFNIKEKCILLLCILPLSEFQFAGQQPIQPINLPRNQANAGNVGNGLMQSLWNSIQLGIKNLIDQLTPNIQLPNLFPSDIANFQLGDIEIPSILGGKIMITGCPQCQNLELSKLPGVWHMVYASDNFLKGQMMTLNKISAGLGLNQGFVGQNSPFVGSSAQNMFNPIRTPVCAKLLVGEAISYGFMIDFPMQFSFREGRPNGKIAVLPGNLRQVGQGRYIMLFAGGAYYIRLCVADSSFVSYKPFTQQIPLAFNPSRYPYQPQSLPRGPKPTTKLDAKNLVEQMLLKYKTGNDTTTAPEADNPHKSQPQREQDLNDTETGNQPEITNQPEPLYMILSDTSGFPSCQNYAVFTTDTNVFFRQFDNRVLNFLKRESADLNANPVQYLGCPCDYENII